MLVYGKRKPLYYCHVDVKQVRIFIKNKETTPELSYKLTCGLDIFPLTKWLSIRPAAKYAWCVLPLTASCVDFVNAWTYMCLCLFQSSASKDNKLVITSVAFQDHITRSLLLPDLLLSDPLLRWNRRAPRNPQARDGRKVPQSLDEHEEREYVLDSAAPPLTLGR